METSALDVEGPWSVDYDELRTLRKRGGMVAVIDVIQLITGFTRANARRLWLRMNELHPELASIVTPVKFKIGGRGGNQEAPAVDASGVVQLLMAIPGPSAVQFRLKAANVIVRYLGGDESLMAEVRQNRAVQQTLAAEQPSHPARLFGEAVEAETPQVDDIQQRLAEAQILALEAQARKDDMEAKHVFLRSVIEATQFCKDKGFESSRKYDDIARNAINACLLPPGQNPDDLLDAKEYLQLLGHSPQETARLAGELGKSLKAARLRIYGEPATTATQDHGPIEKEVGLYSRTKDREFLGAVFAEFQQRPLYRRVVPGNSTLKHQVHQVLQNGRGMALTA